MTTGMIFCIVAAIGVALFFAWLISEDIKTKTPFKVGDNVTFTLEGEKVIGVVAIVDENGTFDNPDSVCYDIMSSVKGKETLIKHVPHNWVRPL